MRRAWLWGGGAVLLLALAGGGALWLASSDWLREQIRQRVVARVERATGGRVELQRLAFDWRADTVQVQGFRLHGSEAAGRAPFVEIADLQLGLNVHSWLRRDVELASLKVRGVAVHIYVDSAGRTNIPTPAGPHEPANPVADLIRLRIGRLDVAQALFEYDSRQIPFATQVEGIDLHLAYDITQTAYQAAVTAQTAHLPGGVAPAVEMQASLAAAGLRIERLKLKQGGSWAEFQGRLDDWRQPRATGEFRGAALARDIPRSPIEQGFAVAQGRLSFDLDKGFELEGTARLEQLAWRGGGQRVEHVRASGGFRMGMRRLEMDSLTVQSPLGQWKGRARLESWQRFQLDGRVSGLSLGVLEAHFSQAQHAWDGSAEGPVALSGWLDGRGVHGVRGSAELAIEPAPGALPVEGRVGLAFDLERGRLDLESSYFATPSFHARVRGRLGDHLELSIRSSELHDLEHAAAIALRRESYKLPVELRGGEARVELSIDGPLETATVSGSLNVTSVAWRDILFDQVSAGIELEHDRLRVEKASLRHGRMQASGRLTLALNNWQLSETGRLEAQSELTGGDLTRLCGLLGWQQAVSGAVEAKLAVHGSLDAPEGKLEFALSDAAWRQERWHSVKGQVELAGAGELKGSATLDEAQLELQGRLQHPAGNFSQLSSQGRLKLSGVELAGLETLSQARPGLRGRLAAEVAFDVSLDDGGARLHSLDGSLSSPEVYLGLRRLGAFRSGATTRGGKLDATFSLAIPSGALEGDAHVELSGDYAATGSVKIPRLPFALLQDAVSPGLDASRQAAWPVRGFLQGALNWSGPLADPERLRAEATVTQLQLRPRDTQVLETQVDTSELTLHNAGPLQFDLTPSALKVRTAKFTARETDLGLGGSYSFGSPSPWNLNVQGSANLAVLGSFHQNLVATGTARVDATIRGPASEPQIGGRMSVSGASFYLKDLPNAVEQASGTIYFERNRANIEKITGQTGGGAFEISGFTDWGGAALSYRLKGVGRNIRVRYPEGVSTTLDSDLTLAGSAARSLLAGTVSVRRASISGGGDLANAVGEAESVLPGAAGQNEFLRNLQFDVRIRSAADAVFLSNYTQDVQTEAELQLRGSPAKPILLGSVKVNQGSVRFFGNQYSVSRGEVLFYSTASLLPQVNLDLETKARGVTIYINVGGPLNRLNINYRSEPPLQSSEIVAILTVGRTPTTESSNVPTSQSIRSQTVMENTTNSLFGGALSAGVSSRVEKFFGSSRIKIDPQATGVENLPQARLSVEQSLSRDITLTYITNLSHSQQQIFRMEWDLNRQWSLIAVKDENGVFAVDFLFRKRLK